MSELYIKPAMNDPAKKQRKKKKICYLSITDASHTAVKNLGVMLN